MRIKMPLSASKITSMTGNSKYGQQFYNAISGKEIVLSTVNMFDTFCRLELANSKPSRIDCWGVAKQVMNETKVESVFFYPLEARLEIQFKD